ncbi:hypothetical protein B0H15DRAFT_1010606 [Mycena belliarum]|uniref:Zn(2)-C6 fungal-type domain-containing protein n=1 Tax=Mycena belliarum TaxID=1033014 RepID=A0AAD6TPE8_9AGAR|nr:hypothetical protein B0H15DRAFT_1010606 [Mycena belliae]
MALYADIDYPFPPPAPTSRLHDWPFDPRPRSPLPPPPQLPPRITLAGSLDPTTGTPEHPRLRTAQACVKCRTRKSKCSGDHPACARCLARGLVCEYAKECRVRGPNKAPRSASTSSALSHPASPASSTPCTASAPSSASPLHHQQRRRRRTATLPPGAAPPLASTRPLALPRPHAHHTQTGAEAKRRSLPAALGGLRLLGSPYAGAGGEYVRHGEQARYGDDDGEARYDGDHGEGRYNDADMRAHHGHHGEEDHASRRASYDSYAGEAGYDAFARALDGGHMRHPHAQQLAAAHSFAGGDKHYGHGHDFAFGHEQHHQLLDSEQHHHHHHHHLDQHHHQEHHSPHSANPDQFQFSPHLHQAHPATLHLDVGLGLGLGLGLGRPPSSACGSGTSSGSREGDGEASGSGSGSASASYDGSNPPSAVATAFPHQPFAPHAPAPAQHLTPRPASQGFDAAPLPSAYSPHTYSPHPHSHPGAGMARRTGGRTARAGLGMRGGSMGSTGVRSKGTRRVPFEGHASSPFEGHSTPFKGHAHAQSSPLEGAYDLLAIGGGAEDAEDADMDGGGDADGVGMEGVQVDGEMHMHMGMGMQGGLGLGLGLPLGFGGGMPGGGGGRLRGWVAPGPDVDVDAGGQGVGAEGAVTGGTPVVHVGRARSGGVVPGAGEREREQERVHGRARAATVGGRGF